MAEYISSKNEFQLKSNINMRSLVQVRSQFLLELFLTIEDLICNRGRISVESVFISG